MNNYVARLEKINARGIKSPKALIEKLHEWEQLGKLPVNEFTKTRNEKLSGAIVDMLTALESKQAKDTRVAYNVSSVLDDSTLSKRALSYNRKVYAIHLLKIDFEYRLQAFERQIANIQSKIPTNQLVEFNALVTSMSMSDIENGTDDETDEQ